MSSICWNNYTHIFICVCALHIHVRMLAYNVWHSKDKFGNKTRAGFVSRAIIMKNVLRLGRARARGCCSTMMSFLTCLVTVWPRCYHMFPGTGPCLGDAEALGQPASLYPTTGSPAPSTSPNLGLAPAVSSHWDATGDIYAESQLISNLRC